MDRTRLHLSLFGWIEKSTRWKRSMVRTRLRLSLFGWNEKFTRWKRSMVRTRLRLSLFWWNEKSTRWKRSMVRTRLRLSLFWWIEKSARWKRSMVRTRLQLSLFWWIEKSKRWKKKVWAEPDFDSAYFGGSKNPNGGKKKYGPNQTSTQPILVDRKIHTVEKDSRFKEHLSLAVCLLKLVVRLTKKGFCASVHLFSGIKNKVQWPKECRPWPAYRSMAAGDGHVFPVSGGAAMDDCKIPLGTVCVQFPRRPQFTVANKGSF